jgi:excisionase family DNA binding protein
MYATVSELAERFRVSRDTIYLWIRTGVIPEMCVDRLGATIRINAAEFERHLRDKKLSRPPRATRVPATRTEISQAAAATDNRTTTGTDHDSEHRWTADDGTVPSDHPYSEPMKALTR